jgi:C-terminal processing protease CtpA/Prc
MLGGCLLVILVSWPAVVAADKPDWGLRVAESRSKEVQVIYVSPRSPAWEMGFRRDDTIKMIGGMKISSNADVQKALDRLEPQQGVKFKIVVHRTYQTSNRPNRSVERTIEGVFQKVKGELTGKIISDREKPL